MASSLPSVSSALTNIDFAIADPKAVSIPDTLKQKGFDSNDDNDFFSVSTFDLQADNWNQIFLYRLIMGEVQKDGSITIIKLKNVELVYNLLIGPQNLSISMPFASQTTVLADGIMVESNGIPLKMISIQGTTGIVPYRDTEATSFDTSALSAFAPNVGRVANNVKSAAQAFNPANVAELAKKKEAIFNNSGYTQFHKLSQFLQYYAFLSKKAKNKDLRLILDLKKDNTSYVVTPKSFSLQRTASAPLEYSYSIQLEAWKRIQLDRPDAGLDNGLTKGLASWTALALAQIKRALRLIAAASEMISAIRADIQRILDVVRSVAVAIKQITGAIVSLIEMPAAILKDIKEAIDEIKTAVTQGISAINQAWITAKNDKWGTKIFANSDDSFTTQGTNKTSSALTGINSTSEQSSSGPGSISTSTPSKGDQAQSTGGGSSGNLLAKAFDEPYTDSNIDFFDAINISDLNLSSNIQIKVNQELQRVANLTRLDFETQRNYINEVSNDIANAFGVGSAKLNRIKGYAVSSFPKFPNNSINRVQYELLAAFRDVANILDAMAVVDNGRASPINQSFDFVGRLAATAGMPFETSTGKFAVPVPYGATIQDISREQLGTADRVTEIIILNRLLPPYIDEEGLYQDVLSASFKNTFNIADGTNLFINQKIIFYANNLAPFSRKIINIQRINENNWQITVDGSTNLNLLLAKKPKIQYFTKNTVSSRDLIFIPSAAPALNLPDQLKPIPTFAPDSDPLIAIARLDILLGSDGDIVIDSKGEMGIAAGLTNILQALKIKFNTPLDSLNRHPGWGFGVRPGTPISEISLSNIKQSIRDTILIDPRFKEVLSTDISYNDSTLRINGVVGINSVGGILPFSINLT